MIHIMLLFFVVTFWGAIVGGGLYFVRRYVRAVEGRVRGDRTVAELEARVASLEDLVESLDKDVERLENGQEFTTRLLADRSRSSSSPA